MLKGILEGDTLGHSLGSLDGTTDGLLVGRAVGDTLGLSDGIAIGCVERVKLGTVVGKADGCNDDGFTLGAHDGRELTGTNDGTALGPLDGD